MGQPADFADFAVALHPRLVGVLALHCGDPQVAQDLAHDALIRVREKWDRVKTANDPRAYAIRVGINLANSRFRRRAAERRALTRMAAREDESRSVGNTVALGQDLREALSTLPPRQREVVIRRYYLDQSTREVADAMAISEGTVASACHRGLATLRGSLDFVIDGQEVHA